MPHPSRDTELKWISARHLQHFLAHAEAANVNANKLLEEAGLTRARLSDPDYLVPVSAIELMLASLTRDHDQPLAGLRLSRDIQPATFGPLGFIAQVCPSFGDVLDVVVRYNGLLSNIGNTSVVHAPGTVEARWECLAGGKVFRRQATEYVLGSFVTLGRLLVPGEANPIAVNFAHPRPQSAKYMREYVSFFQCPVYFERPVSSVVLPATALKTRLRHGDAFVREIMEQHAANLLKHRTTPSTLTDEISHLVRALLADGVPSKDAIAAQLGMSGRSLHRKLQALGGSYQEILDGVRLSIANERLECSAASATEISDSLGFSTRQAFLRWFKQKTGKTPAQFREKSTRNPSSRGAEAGS